jgi:16S rRNA (guanine527-N7)-methyltransferase
LPGIVIALLRPALTIVLVEAQSRRTRFLDEVVAELGLQHIRVVHGRAGAAARLDVPPSDFVTARAVAPLVDLVPACWPLLAPTGQLLAIKGATAQAEVQAASGVLARHGLVAEICLAGVPGAPQPTTVVRVSPAPARGAEGSRPAPLAAAPPRHRPR